MKEALVGLMFFFLVNRDSFHKPKTIITNYMAT